MSTPDLWLNHAGRVCLTNVRQIPGHMRHPSRYCDVTSLSPLAPFSPTCPLTGPRVETPRDEVEAVPGANRSHTYN